MSYRTHATYLERMNKLGHSSETFIPPHGGYAGLLAYRKAVVVFQGTVRFCERFLDKRDRTIDQMIQAARSGETKHRRGEQSVRHFEGGRDKTDQCGSRQPGRAFRRLSRFFFVPSFRTNKASRLSFGQGCYIRTR